MPPSAIIRILAPPSASLYAMPAMIDVAVFETALGRAVQGGFAQVVDEVGRVCVAVVVFVLEDVRFFHAGG